MALIVRPLRSSCCSVNDGDAVEGVFQKAAFAAGADHVDGHLVEGPREAGHRVAERRAVFDAAIDLVEDAL